MVNILHIKIIMFKNLLHMSAKLEQCSHFVNCYVPSCQIIFTHEV